MAKKRPSIRDKEVIKVAATRLLDEVISWLEQSGDTTDYAEDEEERNNVLEQLVDAIDGSSDTDGYQLARQLDQAGWDPDSRLVEILDSVSSYLRTEVSRLSVIWFAEEGFTIIPNGSRVKSKKNHSGLGEIGKVIDFHNDGRYTVNFPQLGHKNPDDHSASGCSGFIIEHELLEPVP
jgi:hypothetical protein